MHQDTTKSYPLCSKTATSAGNKPNVSLVSFQDASLASRFLSSRCSAYCAPPGALAVYNVGSGRELCCWRRLFIAHKRLTARKKKEEQNQCHPESSIIVPILFPTQKDHLLAALDSVRRDNSMPLYSDSPPFSTS